MGLENWLTIAKLCQKMLVELFGSKLMIIECICMTFYSNDLKYHQNMIYVFEHNKAITTNNSSFINQKLLKSTSFFPTHIN